MQSATFDAPRVNPWVDAIHAYVPGKSAAPGGKPLAKLSSNENPFGPPPAAVEAMARAGANAHRYPDGSSTKLRTAIAAKYDLEFDRLICGAGSDELLQFVPTCFAGPGDEVLMPRHAFAVYPIATRRVGAIPVEAPDRDYVADVDALLAAVTSRTRIVMLADPNNPTGTVLAEGEVARLHASLRSDILLVLDGAYAEYLDGDPGYADGLALARVAPNVLATRTFSKIHGLAAARVGWAYGPRHVIEAMDKVRGPFNLTTPALEGAVAALADDGHAERARVHNSRWREWFARDTASLGNHGVRAVPSAANFILFEFPEAGPVIAEAAFHALMAEGFITRWLVPQNMPRCLRISIGTEAETRGVAAALRTFVESASA